MFHLSAATPPYLDLDRLAALCGDSHQLPDTLLALLESNSSILPGDAPAASSQSDIDIPTQRLGQPELRYPTQQPPRHLPTRCRPVLTSCSHPSKDGGDNNNNNNNDSNSNNKNNHLGQNTMPVEGDQPQQDASAASPAPLRLQPNSLYLLLSTRRSSSTENSENGPTGAITGDNGNVIGSSGGGTGGNGGISGPLPFRDQQDRPFKWGLYWSRSFGVGRSYRYRYCPRDETWQFEQDWHPSSSKPGRAPIETYERIVAALHIENMDEQMATRLGERLDAKHFLHSHSERRSVRSLSETDLDIVQDLDFDRLDRSRTWVGHALVLLNNEGFISLKDSSRGALWVEREALALAKENVSTSPPRRTVARSDNVIYDART